MVIAKARVSCRSKFDEGRSNMMSVPSSIASSCPVNLLQNRELRRLENND